MRPVEGERADAEAAAVIYVGCAAVLICALLVAGHRIRARRRKERRAMHMHKFDETREVGKQRRTDRNRDEQARGIWRDQNGNLPDGES